MLVALDITPPLVQTDGAAGGLRGHRVAAAAAPSCAWLGRRTDYALRGGWATCRRRCRDQIGLTSFADGDRLLVALGAGVDAGRLAADPDPADRLRLAIAAGSTSSAALTRKDAMAFPGQAFSSGGDILHGVASTTVRF